MREKEQRERKWVRDCAREFHKHIFKNYTNVNTWFLSYFVSRLSVACLVPRVSSNVVINVIGWMLIQFTNIQYTYIIVYVIQFRSNSITRIQTKKRLIMNYYLSICSVHQCKIYINKNLYTNYHHILWIKFALFVVEFQNY